MIRQTKDFINRGTMPLVGRDREIRVLLDSFNELLEGEPRAVWMSGPAGVGKSRLLDELKGVMAPPIAAVAHCPRPVPERLCLPNGLASLAA